MKAPEERFTQFFEAGVGLLVAFLNPLLGLQEPGAAEPTPEQLAELHKKSQARIHERTGLLESFLEGDTPIVGDIDMMSNAAITDVSRKRASIAQKLLASFVATVPVLKISDDDLWIHTTKDKITTVSLAILEVALGPMGSMGPWSMEPWIIWAGTFSSRRH